MDDDFLPEVGYLFFEHKLETFLDLLKFVFFFMGDGSNPVGSVPMHVTGAKGKTVMDQSWVNHETTFGSVQ